MDAHGDQDRKLAHNATGGTAPTYQPGPNGLPRTGKHIAMAIR